MPQTGEDNGADYNGGMEAGSFRERMPGGGGHVGAQHVLARAPSLVKQRPSAVHRSSSNMKDDNGEIIMK